MPAKPNTNINNINLEQVVRMLPKERRGQVRLDGDTEGPVDETPIKRSSARLPRSKSYEEALASVKAKTAEVAARKAIDYESRVLQDSFPFWDDDNRGVPNPLIRGGLFGVGTSAKREFLPNMAVASLSNYEITYTGQDLQQDDLSVWMSLINLARKSPLSDKVRFTGYQLIRDLGWRMHSESYRRAQESIERLKVTGIKIATKDQSEGYSGSLIREFAWADADENGNTKWMVRFEPRVSVLFMSDTTTLLEWETRKKIGNRAVVAQWLHAFYATHRDPLPLSVQKLHELCRSSAQISTFRRNLRNALDKLIEHGFLRSFQIVNDQVYLVRTNKASLSVVNDPNKLPGK
ncbi:plasmid replication initiator TrfA [Hydrogenophaga sp.]|uniref:plasmid replication initiator TrfA n=1 Tax=Hydrogenophaga sp. TaxID=1904254 RepID=UPI0026039DB6|nr:plasmid replication initiator TrfA [Hydrogenophaga sp.]